MTGLEDLRERWLAARPQYERLSVHVRRALDQDLRKRGLLVSVSGRAKEVASLLKKALVKQYASPFEDIRDKAGVRVVVGLADEVSDVEAAICERFEVLNRENKTLGLGPNVLGYLGVHFEVTLKDGDAPPELKGLIAEVQVHTKAQNCWADVSHRLLYKPVGEAPHEVKRRIFRLMALVELFDETVMDARKAIAMLPGNVAGQMLAELEQYFFQFVGRPYHPELSIELIGALEGAYAPHEKTTFSDLMREFVAGNRIQLDRMFADYRNDDRANPLIFQPEVFLLLERLVHDPFDLRDRWTAVMPLDILENLAVVWGRPL